MDLRLLRGGPDLAATLRLLRPAAAAGLALAALCGALLFVTQATDYVGNPWFRAKLALVALATLNAVAHPRLLALSPRRRRLAAAASLSLWPAALLCGRMIGYA